MSKKSEEFKQHAYQVIDWIADYFDELENFPVKSQVKPGEISDQLPESAPRNAESFDRIMKDLHEILLPGITHWQSPKFFAYFPANSSIPSLYAEMITAAIGAQCMKWETSPSAAELEERVMNWLRDAIGLPGFFQGVIQDSASTATLVSLLTAREKYSNYEINESGFKVDDQFTVYCSEETHSSIERAVKVAGIGKKNLRKIPVDENFSMDAGELKKAIQDDLEAGNQPMAIVATIGTTGSTAIDPLDEIAAIKKEFNLWLHVDAAYAGTALLLPEYRYMIRGIEEVDTFVFNPHKWMFTNFDCSAYYVKDKNALINTFQIVPEYLKTRSDSQVNNYSDWTIPLGRRFRALKLWFVMRYYGLEHLKEKLYAHIQMAHKLKAWVDNDADFEMVAPLTLNLVCFRYHPARIQSPEKLNELNEKLLHQVNATGKIYFTHTKLAGKYTLRMVVAQTDVELKHVEEGWQLIQETARSL
jgi:aromatic-L-amino-acid decarboxylase